MSEPIRRLADTVVRRGAGSDVALLGGVLAAYGPLFGHRLWLAARRR